MRLCISDQTLVSNHRSCKIVNNNINTIFINEGFILRHESNLIVCIQVRFWIFVIKIYFLSFFLFDILLIFLEINFLIKIFVVVPLIWGMSDLFLGGYLIFIWRKLILFRVFLLIAHYLRVLHELENKKNSNKYIFCIRLKCFESN